MTDARHQAARWFARLLELPSDHPERASFAQWLAADPRHAEEYQAFTDLWEGFAHTSQTQALAGAMEGVKRRRLLGGSLFGLLAISGFGGWLAWSRLVGRELRYATGIAEQLTVELADGSQLTLDADTRLLVRFTRQERHLVLLHGRAIFGVQRDSQRPFLVEAGLARVRVLGTRFVVERLPEQVQVSVEHGRVQVDSDTEQALLEAGQVVRCNAAGQLTRLHRSAAAAFSFADGNLSFEDASLQEVAAVLSRYLRRPLMVFGQSPQRLSAVVQLGDVETFVQTLPALANATLQTREDATWLLPR
ncbi:FecR family protein [Pseudomonas sp. NPDC089401]|uniref:FecR family protein n=1 Tax=Pseudomonas sp. NPDC089401 TaxID=3364462 RepID=UPI00380D9C56